MSFAFVFALCVVCDITVRPLLTNNSISLRIEIFKMLLSLHDIGISHADIDTRNILQSPNGSFKIIDFSLSALHDCEGIRDVSFYLLV